MGISKIEWYLVFQIVELELFTPEEVKRWRENELTKLPTQVSLSVLGKSLKTMNKIETWHRTPFFKSMFNLIKPALIAIITIGLVALLIYLHMTKKFSLPCCLIKKFFRSSKSKPKTTPQKGESLFAL